MESKKTNRKKYLIILLPTVLILVLFGMTFAFFNYTRTGQENTIRVGRISFSTRQTKTINLSNAFPIATSEIDTDTDNVDELTITITGDTDYVGGVEYLVTTEDVHIYTSEGKQVPISLDMTVTGLGNPNSNYFTARNSKDTTMYKIMSVGTVVGEQQLLVGYIKPNTISGQIEGVNGSITIKAYFDKDKIAITDTPKENVEWQEGRTVISTVEWNSLQANGISFKVKIEANEGIWVGEPFYEVMKRSTVMDNINSTYVNNATPGIDFSKISGDTNGKGIYTYSSTENDAYPIMYYRGDVDNNVLFGGFCWKIVRTTDTGGIKLIYNGNPVNNQCGNDRIIEKNQIIEIDLSELADSVESFGESYSFDSTNNVFILTGNVLQSGFNADTIDNLVGKYYCNSNQAASTCSSLVKVNSYNSSTGKVGFIQVTQDSSIMLDDDNSYKNNTLYNSDAFLPASVGYMYGGNYSLGTGLPSNPTQVYFGSGFTYKNGVYKLVDPVKISGVQTFDTHHYTCGLTTIDGTCESIWYYVLYAHFDSGWIRNYIVLTNGKGVDDALEEMFTNTNDSLAKIMIDTWYSENMVSYTDKLEDTVYCNSRNIYQYGAWNPNGGSVSSSSSLLGFRGGYLKCLQKNDAFTMSSEKGNGKLDYPVGMLAGVEAELAGAIYGLDNLNTSFYLYDGNGYWTMDPYSFQVVGYIGRVYAGGNTGGTRVDHAGYMSGFRPVISLKEGTSVVSGTGTPTDPFIVK